MALGRHHTPMPAGGGIHPISSNQPALREVNALSDYVVEIAPA